MTSSCDSAAAVLQDSSSSRGPRCKLRCPSGLVAFCRGPVLNPSLPKGSNVVPFGLWPIFFLGIIIYCPKRNYIGASAYRTPHRTSFDDGSCVLPKGALERGEQVAVLVRYGSTWCLFCPITTFNYQNHHNFVGDL